MTPHKYSGPSDITRVFGYDEVMGMHLKEYTYREMKHLFKEAGFKKLFAVWNLPNKIRHKLKINNKSISNIFIINSKLYFKYLILIERIIELFPQQRQKRSVTNILRLLLYNPSIFVIAQK